MVWSCCAYNCRETFKKGGLVKFHSFPKDSERCKLWVSKLKRADFKVTKYSKICSKHFTPDCVDTLKFGGTWLKSDACPTIFDFGESSHSKPIPRKPPMKRVNSPDASSQNVVTKRFHFVGDFNEEDVTSPPKAQKLLQVSQTQINAYKQTIRKLRKENMRLKKRVTSLTSMLSELKEKRMISEDASAVLKLSLPGAAAEFLNRLEMPNSKQDYPPELRRFALTLNSISAKAYDYVRRTFQCNLPHPTTLRKWYKTIDVDKIKGALMVDEMAIKKHVEWDSTKFPGSIDLGTDLDDDELPVAEETLVFMVNTVDSHWKVPTIEDHVHDLGQVEKIKSSSVNENGTGSRNILHKVDE